MNLDAAVAFGVLDAVSSQRLKDFLATRMPEDIAAMPPGHSASVARAKFDLMTYPLWYGGALITMGAMGIFASFAFLMMGGGGLILTGLIYGAGLWYAGDRLWRAEATRTPGGLLIVAAIAMAALVVHGIQMESGLWPGRDLRYYRDFFYRFNGDWLPKEIVIILVSLVATQRYSFAFIMFPAAVCLWFVSVDISSYYLGEDTFFSVLVWQPGSYGCGVVLFVAAWIYERRPRRTDYAFWLHLVAAMAFWGALAARWSGGEFARVLYCLINVGLLGLSLYMGRWIYGIFGIIGVTIYIGNLVHKVFEDSLLFPFALSLFGLGMIGLGIYYVRHRALIEAKLAEWLPKNLSAIRPWSARRMDP